MTKNGKGRRRWRVTYTTNQLAISSTSPTRTKPSARKEPKDDVLRSP